MISIKTFNNSKHIVITRLPNPFHNLHMISNYGKFNKDIIHLLMNDVKHGSIDCYDSIYELYDLIYQHSAIIIPLNVFNQSIPIFKNKFKILFYVYNNDLHRCHLYDSINLLFKEPFQE